ncbi:tail fiber domain-containing protein [Umezawaea sp. Da 62-37]|uniref:tail fiber domain-containing protein n=1 Tax=Umezawaea sp. Da 62-37 TaxID=3075927 RepID=UPI0028F6FA8E|nr:tail fiber domain-containing protein [Umezawaea sp. Da 62-37]WNV90321.1 tail fiber domain-containing protein [Umezawaea sp. Da 62-37]
MALSSYPFDEQATTETQYSALFRELQDSGVVDSATGNGFAVSADAGGMYVDVQPGFAIVRGHAVLSTAVERLPVPTADPLARTDRVVLRLDPGQNEIVLEVVKGEPGAGLPPLTRTDSGVFEIPLSKVPVPTGATNIGTTVPQDDRQFVSGRVGVWRTETRPSDPRVGRLGLNLGTGRWEWFNGSTWVDLAPVSVWSTIEGKPGTFAPAPHRHHWNDLDGVPASFTPAAHTHAWDSVTGKPSSFPPSGHTHGKSDITGLQADLNYLSNNKAWADHGHGDYATWGHRHGGGDIDGHVNRAWGTDRVHTNGPGPGPWYAAWVDGNRNFCQNTSARRFKENIQDYWIDPARVLALRPRTYDRKNTDHKHELGLIAEEVDQTLPEIVQRNEDGVIMSLRYDLLGVALIPVVQDQQNRIERLERLVAELMERGA